MTTKLTALQTEEAVHTTGLNSLADGANALSASFSNDDAAERWPKAMFEIELATQGAARAADAHIAVYILPALDGTNYSYGDGSTDPSPANFAFAVGFDAATTARKVTVDNIDLPAGDFKVLLINETGQALAASGNALNMRRYSVEDV